ncbi:MAG TPA: heparan-alpha-glucosaminide N-acetyltransferase domain-containing protein [Ignavibacteriaceae bacterium]|nr:heparan-alpha-glucosaminide N-acetyltransferase domain-containing protein [Ignavibacteriaceae bacterium]
MKEKVRFIFVDLLRGWALLVMFEVHSFNVLLKPALQKTDWFNNLNFVNGLVAPSFLFISGFAFILSTQKNLDELRKFGMKFWKKLARIGMVFLVGYSLHIPFLSIRLIHERANQQMMLAAYNVDILQCIAAGLLFIFIARLIFVSDKHYNIFLIVSFLLVILISPLFWQIDFTKFLHPFLADYFNSNNGSYFPLFPWMGFLIAGAIVCVFFLQEREKGNEKKFIYLIAIIGLGFAFAGHFFLSEIFQLNSFSVKPHPAFFFQRLGYVLFLLGLCWYYAEKRQTKTSFVLDIGRESLLVYWLHLQILYRHVLNGQNIASIYGGTFNVLQSVLFTIALAIAMIIVAKIWGAIKMRYRDISSRLTLTVIVVCILIFFIY